MPLQNRVDPFGKIYAVPERGTCMGNRGELHTRQHQLKRYYQHKAWIICKLSTKKQSRKLMNPGHYTELFFLDEATALAAGHRPCGFCCRGRYKEFVRLWRLAHPGVTEHLDHILHAQRIEPYKPRTHTKITYREAIETLPYGTFITLGGQPYIVLENTLRPWSFRGYGPAIPRLKDALVTVITPKATVRTLAQGYRPKVYPEDY